MGLGRAIISIEWQINAHIRNSKFIYYRVPVIGKFCSLLYDRTLMFLYGIDMGSFSVNVKKLSISHPNGVLLGGNGLYSTGRVVIMAGVKFGGKSYLSPDYLEKHRIQRVFELGDNVVIGSNSVVLGPVSICDNVIIGAMSLVNKSIYEPGIYVGVPAVKVSDNFNEEWVSHL